MIEGNTGARVRQCTVTADVPPGELLLAMLAGQRRVSDCDIGRVPLTVRCELGLWHEGDHADWVWDWDHRPTHALWARWVADEPMRFESLPWCETPDTPDIDPNTIYCALYRDPQDARPLSTTLRRVVPQSPPPASLGGGVSFPARIGRDGAQTLRAIPFTH
jgi:hypothetical protein